MLDYATYQRLVQQLQDGRCSVAALFDEARRLPDEEARRFRTEIQQAGETDVRILFYRVLYRFHLKHPDIRHEYLGLIQGMRAWRRTPRANIIYCADLIDVGEYDAAFDRLRSFLWWRNRRWRISALFQMLRIGHHSAVHRSRCLAYARSLRTILEADFSRRHHEDRVAKYALCSLFVTLCHLRTLKGDANSGMIREVAGRLESGIEDLLADERSWDAC